MSALPSTLFDGDASIEANRADAVQSFHNEIHAVATVETATDAALAPRSRKHLRVESQYSETVDDVAAKYATYQQRKRARQGLGDVQATVAPPGPAATYDTMGFSQRTCYCTHCKELKPVGDFHQSCLRRHVFYCKRCSRAKQVASLAGPSHRIPARPKAAAAFVGHDSTMAAVAKDGSAVEETGAAATGATSSQTHLKRLVRAHEDSAVLLQNRFRRSYQRMGGGKIGFDVSVTRQLLAYWGHATALRLHGPDTLPDEEKQQGDLFKHDKQDADLQLMVWLNKTDLQDELQPWEVVLVTRAQLKRLRSVPRQVWPDLLNADMVASVDARLAEIKRKMLSVVRNDEKSASMDA